MVTVSSRSLPPWCPVPLPRDRALSSRWPGGSRPSPVRPVATGSVSQHCGASARARRPAAQLPERARSCRSRPSAGPAPGAAPPWWSRARRWPDPRGGSRERAGGRRTGVSMRPREVRRPRIRSAACRGPRDARPVDRPPAETRVRRDFLGQLVLPYQGRLARRGRRPAPRGHDLETPRIRRFGTIGVGLALSGMCTTWRTSRPSETARAPHDVDDVVVPAGGDKAHPGAALLDDRVGSDGSAVGDEGGFREEGRDRLPRTCGRRSEGRS